MTRDEILALSPGRELDELVFKYVMGGQLPQPLRPNFTKYSSDISAAWEMVDKIRDCLHLKQHGSKGEWEASFCGYPESIAHGETAPEAISKAALLAVMNL